MRIAVSGSHCLGKSTFVQDFIKQWPMYSTPKEKYTDLKKKRNFTINESGTEESQRKILTFISDQVIGKTKEDNIIFDRCVLDNLVYTLWLNNYDKVPNSLVKDTINAVRSTLIFYDVIFFTPITKVSPINLEDSGHRSVDPIYRAEIDNIFKSLMQTYYKNSTVYFPFDHELGCPAIIELYGSREERIELAKMYINKEGKSYGEGESLIASEDLSPEEQAIFEYVNGVRLT